MNFRRDIGYSARGADDINRKPPTAEQSIPSVCASVYSTLCMSRSVYTCLLYV